MALATAIVDREQHAGHDAPREDPILRMERVNKTFQKQHVLQDLDLEIGRGEFLTLLGPSGCGKSTTLNIVAGLLAPDDGRVFLRGTLANTLAPQRRRLGMVFQSWALFPHMTVFDNIAYGLRMQGERDQATLRRKVGEMLELVRLPAAEHKFPSQLSGGMQQRVALARALVTEPDLLLLDEPLSNLDAALRKEMQVELKHIHERLKVSTLLVTHSQEEALVMSDRIAVMRGGRIERIDAPHAIYSDPRTSFVCTFIGDANVMTGTVSARNGATTRVSAGGLEFTAPAFDGWREGETVTFALRPEALAIGPQAASHTNAWTGDVTDQIFKGSNVTYEVNAGGQRLTVFALPQAAGGRLFRRGEQVTLGFAPDSVIPLERGGAAA